MMRYYLGVRLKWRGKGQKFEIFRSKDMPTNASHGKLYIYVIGPFRTKRACTWAEKYGANNPHFQNVNDAERLCQIA
jgi:hypothetical protein